ncbi:MAG: NUDIX domain-containing protein [Saprospiraceae bacterium]|jgi:isopentenyldiphosphate isomerase|nr:NUDIX domain-containing protein [Saprospiraceae bacterium]
MEAWDIYDKDRIKTNKVVKRGRPLDQGEFHLVVHVCIFNSSDQLLIQQRQAFKDGWPNKWDLTVGGSAHAGESSRMAAERELFEEIGHKVDLSAIRPSFTINFNGGFDDFYIISEEVNLKDLTLQDSEVKTVCWASKDQIVRMIESGTFIPYHKSLIEMIFDMKNQYGAHANLP